MISKIKEHLVQTIDHRELKQRIDVKAPIRLVMALSEWQYRTKRIPGSVHFATTQAALNGLIKEETIVVYCSDRTCIASAALGKVLEYQGFPHVLHFVGGLAEWEEAGYPLEGQGITEMMLL
jgi:3-mercaptopyruvate sulfurtransferase SseA